VPVEVIGGEVEEDRALGREGDAVLELETGSLADDRRVGCPSSSERASPTTRCGPLDSGGRISLGGGALTTLSSSSWPGLPVARFALCARAARAARADGRSPHDDRVLPMLLIKRGHRSISGLRVHL
jgi:hypothetical protein